MLPPDIERRIELSGRPVRSYRVNRHIEGEETLSPNLLSNTTIRSIVDYIFTKPVIGLDKPSHTGEFAIRPKTSLSEPVDFKRIRIPADPEAFPIVHWWDWIISESRWGYQNHAVAGLDLEQLQRMNRPPVKWHLAHTYDEYDQIQRWIGILEPEQLVRVGRQPREITLIAVDTSGNELPLKLIDLIRRTDGRYKKVSWV